MTTPGDNQYLDAVTGMGKFPDLPKFSKEFVDILLAGLQYDPSQRISALNIFELLDGVAFDKITKKEAVNYKTEDE